ncbi:Palmitoyltransferase pfa4 [Fulvia fulva]|uniref:Palmitoyltransferase PFA4 n=1 Tax=Passalora fulva TaxID=5499 RepID=A0A9Q8LDN4_PASFU|nr:Palmitoyltransferase pfa4 [Fulvia fulva]KAK4629006.1 Palmitoyltransferase pfa4 [Fulvia fulva]KAK4630342.1 Palmitoyltransferase pfa4 [Fulvia fulva]UJO15532.1 Palmitoyltransferase pfa4 [Fulvia fulva]WPV12632.1 Palmitoyltransferase pfa4 [Fulvia fulva]WPV27473.1 Palmitoyltransferase pfa4 [Fulvia fulva]
MLHVNNNSIAITATMSLAELPDLQRLSPPGVTLLVAFLALTSQWLFHYIEPGPLRKGDACLFNALVACLLVCYWRTCFTDLGRIPKDWSESVSNDSNLPKLVELDSTAQSNRWCRKCEAFKPPRAHHCKTCKRCVAKMDHHCVWTGRQRGLFICKRQVTSLSANCVSHVTIPHFIRFLCYTVVSMTYLEYFLYVRAALLWEKRALPSYLGPSAFQLGHLFALVGINSLILFALTLLLIRTLWSLAVNTWTIEGWEIERHHTLLRRARVLGGYLEGPDGIKVRIDHQEFPWDVGIWTNICQGMGTSNPLAWLWPFAQSPSGESGLSYPHNEIDDPSKPWPPPDPDRLFRVPRRTFKGDGFTKPWDMNEFRKRQEADTARYADVHDEYVVRRKTFHERLEEAQRQSSRSHHEENDEDAVEDDSEPEPEEPRGRPSKKDEGEESWRNKEGERLADFGVDEDAEFYDEDDLPLAELMRRRQAQ